MQKVIVVGAGVMGASAAYRLAEAGAEVLVLEAGRVGGGTSGISFAWTNAHNKPPRPYHDLNVAGMKAHAALQEEFGAAPWWHGGGSLEWDAEADREAQAANVERLQSWSYGVEWITPRQLHELEPDIDLATVGDAPIAYFPDEGWLDPVPYAHAMLSAACRHGAQLLCGARVTEIVVSGDRVTGVRTAEGVRHDADTVVNCAGRWANEPVRDAGLHLPLAPTVGFLVFTPPVAVGLSRVVRTPMIHARPDGAGRLMLHWNPTDATLSIDTKATPDMAEARDLVTRARRLLPSIGDVAPEAARIAIRPMPGDHLSAIGPVPRVRGYYLAITHSGVTMSPFLGAAVADEVARGRERTELAEFRPARFFN
ncbi:MAG TPA: FAD-dependent oxidoreductase [Acetobacteraceae bacterium]|nr:FAD-dependent oxidoreductase [Acetobacteraceae bacterium]